MAEHAYLELGLRLGRHVDGLVDSYYGPPEIAERVQAELLREPAALAEDAAALALDATGWLHAQLVGLETAARKLAGEEIPFADEVERCYGIRPGRTPDAELERAHAALDDVLPNGGSLAERYDAFRERDGLTGERLQRVVDAVAEELRARTAELFGLPDGESVHFDYVRDEPWSAYNYYLGGLRSRIAVNTDLPVPRSSVAGLIAHETYPGHHTEHVWKERLLVEERGQLEESILLIPTPQSLVAEGIASLAFEALLGDEMDELAARQLAAVGIDYDVDTERRVREAARTLEGVPTNAALLLHEDGASKEDVIEYIRRWGLRNEKRATHTFAFVSDPLWRSYVTTYTDGERVCRAYVRGDPQRFRTLLTEQLTTADLLEAA